MLARRFLYFVAFVILLLLAVGIGWQLFQDRILRAAFVPSQPFTAPADAGAPDYTRAQAWLSRPGLSPDPSRWTPPGVQPAEAPAIAAFYIPPTTYLGNDRWNAPLDNGESNFRLRLFASSQASAFNGVAAVWAPRYRSAAIGAFLTREADAQRAIDFAYGDVARAFDAFLAAVPADQPILLAGHSQGSLHLLRLLRERVAGTPLAARIVAAYAVGWPISREADLPALGLPACETAPQANCILSWLSFAEPADPRQFRALYEGSVGLTGRSRAGTAPLCINPLTGTADGAASASANLGAIVPTAGLGGATIVRGKTGASCDASGYLLIGEDPGGYAPYVMPGNNFHVFDYALFWTNVRADAARRAASFLRR